MVNLDTSDIKSLYLSEISGADLQNFSDFQELIDWSLIEIKKTLYFRTVEDTNKMDNSIKWFITTMT
jgi:hypothetical protein